jgi:hypothetical protein
MLADGFLILTSLLLVALVVTQVLAPLIQNKPLFASFRKSYQREKWLKQQLEETKRRLAELELEKELAEHRNELIRRQMEQMESSTSFASTAAETGEAGPNRPKDISQKER